MEKFDEELIAEGIEPGTVKDDVAHNVSRALESFKRKGMIQARWRQKKLGIKIRVNSVRYHVQGVARSVKNLLLRLVHLG